MAITWEYTTPPRVLTGNIATHRIKEIDNGTPTGNEYEAKLATNHSNFETTMKNLLKDKILEARSEKAAEDALSVIDFTDFETFINT